MRYELSEYEWGCVTPNALHCRCNGRRPQFRDHPQNVCKEIFGNGDFGHLEGDITAVANYLRADLDELLANDRQRHRPVGHRRAGCSSVHRVRPLASTTA